VTVVSNKYVAPAVSTALEINNSTGIENMLRKIIALSLCTFVVSSVSCISRQPQIPGKVFTVETVTKGPVGKAVDFTWKDGSKVMSFSEYTKGKVVLLNLWATWCAPCKREIPDLIEIANEMESKGVVVFGVSVDGDDRKVTLVNNFVEKTSINYINIIDDEMKKISTAYGGIQSIPTTFIIDRQGNVIQKIVGGQTKAQFMTALQRAN